MQSIERTDRECDHLGRQRIRGGKLYALHAARFVGLANGLRVRERLQIALDTNGKLPGRLETRLIEARKSVAGAIRRESREDVSAILKLQTLRPDGSFVGERGMISQRDDRVALARRRFPFHALGLS